MTLPPGWVHHAIAPEVVVRIARDRPALPPDIEARVAAHWRAALAERPTLFNGEVFSADRIAPDAIEGHWTEYRRIIAQLREPGLGLALRPLAVNGLLHGPDFIVFARREPTAIYQAGQWQLPPAGSVERACARPDGTVDVARQLLVELAEELGLPPEAVDLPCPLCAVEHPGSGVLDLGLALRTNWSAGSVATRHRTHGNAEYSELAMVATTEAAAFARARGGSLVPPAFAFLEHFTIQSDRA